MPYIKSDDGRREKLQNGDIAQSAGELNYQIFYYYKYSGGLVDPVTIRHFVYKFLGSKPNYQRWNDMTGCLVRCAKEVERRLGIRTKLLLDIMASYDKEIADYEDKKIIENTDV